MPQFARGEFSVFQSGVSSSIAVTTYPGGRLGLPLKFADDGDAPELVLMIGNRLP